MEKIDCKENEFKSNNVLTNVIWRFAERCGAQIIQFIVSIILARMLAPETYGTISLIMIFTTIFQVFVDSGLGNALIQKKDADDLDFSTVFYTNVVFCIILYIIIFLISPIIANFYNNQHLIVLIRILGITVLVSGIKNIQQAYVSKKLMFKKFFWATIIGTIFAAIVGVTMAVNGFGVWALVAQQLTNLIVDTIILWITVKWRPKLQFSFQRLKGLFSYGWKLLISALLDTFYNNICQLIIGKKYSSADLAYYNKGKQFPDLIINNVNTAVDSVLLPTMSNVQDDKEKVKNMTRKSIKVSVFIMAPLMMGLAFTSNNVVELLLTSKWLPVVPFLCIYCIANMFYPIHTSNLNAIKAMGRSDLFLKLEIIKKIVGILLLLITMNISVIAMAYSLLITSFLSQIINSWPNKKLLNYSYIDQMKDILPSIILAVIMGGIINVFNLLNLSIILKLMIQVIVGGIIYITGAKLLNLEGFNYLLNMLKEIIKKVNKEK